MPLWSFAPLFPIQYEPDPEIFTPTPYQINHIFLQLPMGQRTCCNFGKFQSGFKYQMSSSAAIGTRLYGTLGQKTNALRSLILRRLNPLQLCIRFFDSSNFRLSWFCFCCISILNKSPISLDRRLSFFSINKQLASLSVIIQAYNFWN